MDCTPFFIQDQFPFWEAGGADPHHCFSFAVFIRDITSRGPAVTGSTTVSSRPQGLKPHASCEGGIGHLLSMTVTSLVGVDTRVHCCITITIA